MKSDSLSVHSKMDAASSVVKTLNRGDSVVVEMTLAGDKGEWCGIHEANQNGRLGYVLCEFLEREPRPKIAPIAPTAPAAAQTAPSRGGVRFTQPAWDPDHLKTAGEQRYYGFAAVMAVNFGFSPGQQAQVLQISQQTGLDGCIERTNEFYKQGRVPPDMLSSGPMHQCSWVAQNFYEQVLALTTLEQRKLNARTFEEYSKQLAGQRQLLERRARSGR